jgi:hypothetical protein
MYINAVANGFILQLYLRHNFYNLTFNMKHKLDTPSGSAPPPPQCKTLGAHLAQICLLAEEQKWTLTALEIDNMATAFG